MFALCKEEQGLFFPLRVCDCYLQYDNKEVFESYRWDGTGELVDGASQSQQEGRLFTPSSPPPPSQVSCHIRAVTWSATHSQHGRRSEGSSLYYSDIKLKKMKKITNKIKTEESRRAGREGWGGVQAR